jgi:hypothetical protein
MEDITVLYRMCGISSTNPSPWSQENKFNLNTVCLKSFVMAFSDVKVKTHFILDFCGPEYDKMLQDVAKNYTFEHSEAGINATMLKSYELASKEKGFVLFAECDYIWRPIVGRVFIDALKELDIVSPYDHRNFYIDRTIHSPTCDLQLIDDCHFRTTERNTMTWGTHSDTVRECREILDTFGYLDDKVWSMLLIMGKRLWVPVPSMATHCVKDYLAPGVSWESLWKAYQFQS